MGLLRIDGDVAGALGAVQRQTILLYPNAAARDAELTAPRKGWLTWLDDPGRHEYWNGTAWAIVGGDASLAARVSALETRMTAAETNITVLQTKVAQLEAKPAAPRWTGGATAITTGAEGTAAIAHGLGTTPTTALAVVQYQVLGGGAITDVCDIDYVNATHIGVRMANNHGDFLNSANLAVWWLAIAPAAATLDLADLDDLDDLIALEG